jgi:hypothetical protein
MQLLSYRKYPVIDGQTLVEFVGHERLFRRSDGSFLLYMSSDGKPETEERIAWLAVRDAISWLNEDSDQFGSFWDSAEVIPRDCKASRGPRSSVERGITKHRD